MPTFIEDGHKITSFIGKYIWNKKSHHAFIVQEYVILDFCMENIFDMLYKFLHLLVENMTY